MQKIPQVRNQDESFFSEELACDFCTETRVPEKDGQKIESNVPPCHRCIGLIYALKSKMYFIVT